jgi:hypothetical protein
MLVADRGKAPMTGRSALVIAATVLLAACGEMRRDLLPRTHTMSMSPDGRSTAWVRQSFNIDPPDDHLYLKGPDGAVVKLLDLAPDADWCRSIIWTPDSSRVAFLVTDNRLSVFDVRSHDHLAEVVLVKIDGYPGSEAARNLAFADEGRTVSFERIDRWSQRLISRETMRLPTTRLRVRLLWADTGAAFGSTWARIVASDGAEMRARVEPAADGVATLPAFRDGLMRLVEFGARQPNKTVIVRNVPTAAEPIVVRFDR